MDLSLDSPHCKSTIPMLFWTEEFVQMRLPAGVSATVNASVPWTIRNAPTDIQLFALGFLGPPPQESSRKPV
jgi:hypothetical protein